MWRKLEGRRLGGGGLCLGCDFAGATVEVLDVELQVAPEETHHKLPVPILDLDHSPWTTVGRSSQPVFLFSFRKCVPSTCLLLSCNSSLLCGGTERLKKKRHVKEGMCRPGRDSG